MVMAHKEGFFAPFRPITAEVDGLTYRGQYRTEERTITVRFQGRQMTNELGVSPAAAEVLARAMLSKLVRGDGRAVG
jgi:hypothetical protein